MSVSSSIAAPVPLGAPRRAWLTDLPVLLVAVVWGASYLAAKGITATHTVIAVLVLRFAVVLPVLVVAGQGDGIAPRGAVFAVKDLLPNAPWVRLETGPGGHLGVLTGRAAARASWRYVDEFLTDVAIEEVAENVIAEAA